MDRHQAERALDAGADVVVAQGVSMGTRFLAGREMRVAEAWEQRIVAADALEAVKVDNDDAFMPPYTLPGVAAQPRAAHTLIDRLREDPGSTAEVGPAFLEAVLDGRGHEYLPFAGQSVALVDQVLPAAEILRRASSRRPRPPSAASPPPGSRRRRNLSPRAIRQAPNSGST